MNTFVTLATTFTLDIRPKQIRSANGRENRSVRKKTSRLTPVLRNMATRSLSIFILVKYAVTASNISALYF